MSVASKMQYCNYILQELLHEFYKRLRNYNSEIRRMKNLREHHHANNQRILNIGAIKFANR